MDLSIIVLSYNTCEITLRCLRALINSLNNKINWEIIVIDNGSTDDSVQNIKNQMSHLRQGFGGQANFKIIINNKNLGFARANNQGAKIAKGKYILFLNSDIIVNNIDFKDLVEYLDQHQDTAALTVKVKLDNGEIDQASNRGFPHLWRSFCYFSGLEKIFGRLLYLSKLFGGYHLLNKDFNKIHEIDSPSGAFFLVRKNIFKQVGGFDEDFFMYGEDLDLAFRIKKQSYRIVYYPLQTVTHLKYQSGLLHNDKKIKQSIKSHFYQAMKIFYDKHYASKYSPVINNLIHLLINLKQSI